MLEVEVTLDELAEILGEELELPRIEPKGKSKIVADKDTLHRHPPRRPGVAAPLQAHLSSEALQAADRHRAPTTRAPGVVPVRDDKRYRILEDRRPSPQSNAVIIYMMDVSGSMGDEQKEIVRIESLLDRHLAAQPVQGPRERYIIHDAAAREVDRETFFHTRESGGTMISWPTSCAPKMIEDDYPPNEWNIYPFHFSDGDNWSIDDTLTVRRAAEADSCCPRATCSATARSRAPTARASSSRTCASTSARTTAWSLREITRQGRHRGSHQGLPGEGEVSDDRVRPRTSLPALPARRAGGDRGATPADYGLDFFAIVFEILCYDADEHGRRLRRLPQPLPALALRHGVRAALARATSTACPRSTRWSSTTTPATPTCSRATRWSTRSSSWPTSSGTSTSSRTTSASVRPTSMRPDTIDPVQSRRL